MYQKIDDVMFRITMCISKKKGLTEAYRDTEPLWWFINTGRASTPFLKSLIACKPFVIARVLAKGGSTDDAVRAVIKKLGVDQKY